MIPSLEQWLELSLVDARRLGVVGSNYPSDLICCNSLFKSRKKSITKLIPGYWYRQTASRQDCIPGNPPVPSWSAFNATATDDQSEVTNGAESNQ